MRGDFAAACSIYINIKYVFVYDISCIYKLYILIIGLFWGNNIHISGNFRAIVPDGLMGLCNQTTIIIIKKNLTEK